MGQRDFCSVGQSQFASKGYTSGPWYTILLYYWDAGSMPILSGTDTTLSAYGSCKKDYAADQCGKCFYGQSPLVTIPGSQTYALVYSCMMINGQQKEELQLLARSDLRLGSPEYGQWLEVIYPVLNSVLPLGRVTQYGDRALATNCVFLV